jgi:CRISPR/Cas system CMR subunit Cmr6 (Cas7 group RAMP superfamily)
MSYSIPLSDDSAKSVGRYAEKVDNRSLLFDKFPFPKVDSSGNEFKEASKWSLMRVANGGTDLLEEESKAKRKEAEGKRTEEQNRSIYRAQAEMALKLSKAATPPEDIPHIRQKHALRMWELIEQSHPGYHGCFQARLGGRLAINLADGIIENAGMCLDRIFGEPMIPASALKGVARNCALWDVRQTTDINQRKQKLKLLAGVFGFGDNELKSEGDFAWAIGDPTEFKAFMSSLKEDACKGGVAFFSAQTL